MKTLKENQKAAGAPDTRKENVLAHIQAEQAELLQLAHSLTPSEWDTPSLCEGWRVRDVAAHLIGIHREWYKPNPVGKRRNVTLPALLEELDSSMKTSGPVRFMPLNYLYENWVHQQDMRWRLGQSRQRYQDPERLRLLLDMRAKQAAKKFGHLSFEATDLDWKWGTGERKSGPAEAILMFLSGRSEALNHLS